MRIEVLIGTSRIRVRYAETDQMGTAYHANYFAWFEVGRTELLRSRGLPYAELEALSFGTPVVECGAAYHAPARYDDIVEVEARLVRASRLRLEFEYTLRRSPTGELLTTGFTRHVFMDKSGRARRLPADSAIWRRLEASLDGAEDRGSTIEDRA